MLETIREYGLERLALSGEEDAVRQALRVHLAAIESGNTYINVHTDDGVAPANTGPGDFPGGEIRGQVR